MNLSSDRKVYFIYLVKNKYIFKIFEVITILIYA